VWRTWLEFDSFIKQLIVSVLAQFFKHGQMHCVVSASFRPAKESNNSLPIRSFGKSSPSTGCIGEFSNNDWPKIVFIVVCQFVTDLGMWDIRLTVLDRKKCETERTPKTCEFKPDFQFCVFRGCAGYTGPPKENLIGYCSTFYRFDLISVDWTLCMKTLTVIKITWVK